MPFRTLHSKAILSLLEGSTESQSPPSIHFIRQPRFQRIEPCLKVEALSVKPNIASLIFAGKGLECTHFATSLSAMKA